LHLQQLTLVVLVAPYGIITALTSRSVTYTNLHQKPKSFYRHPTLLLPLLLRYTWFWDSNLLWVG